jgi:hypothetical protein
MIAFSVRIVRTFTRITIQFLLHLSVFSIISAEDKGRLNCFGMRLTIDFLGGDV